MPEPSACQRSPARPNFFDKLKQKWGISPHFCRLRAGLSASLNAEWGLQPPPHLPCRENITLSTVSGLRRKSPEPFQYTGRFVKMQISLKGYGDDTPNPFAAEPGSRPRRGNTARPGNRNRAQTRDFRVQSSISFSHFRMSPVTASISKSISRPSFSASPSYTGRPSS